MTIEVKLPELGDGIDSADVLHVLVREGDHVQKNQGILEIETDKATVEVPTPYAGVVRRVFVQPGQTITPGTTILALEPAGEAALKTTPAGPAAPSSSWTEHEAKPQGTGEPVVSAPTAAGGTPQATRTADRSVPPVRNATAGSSAPIVAPVAPSTSRPSAAAAPTAESVEPSAATPPLAVKQPRSSFGTIIPAGPAVRRFAREVGVDLRTVAGSGPGGRITREDVLAVVRAASQALTAKASTTDAWGPIRTERLSKIRRTIAEKMHQSWSTVPRVTNFDDADVTELERIRQASKEDYARKGIKLTALPFVIKAVAMALRDHPLLNASLDVEHDQIIYKEYIHIGIAVDSDRGLVVPVLRHADTKSIADIARSVMELSEKVHTGNYTVEDLRGGTFTVSNLGAIGGTYSTPIVNTPEVAILLIGRARKMPVVVQDQIAIRLIMPLSLSYDHRLVDGAVAARFLNDVIGFLEAPSRLLLAP